jgi:hypothetical protein
VNDVTVVTIPMNKLMQAKPTKAVLGTEKIKLAGYINGIAEKL